MSLTNVFIRQHTKNLQITIFTNLNDCYRKRRNPRITKVGKPGGGNNSDLVWVGQACNNAALFCSKVTNSIYIGINVKNKLEQGKITNGNGQAIWQQVLITDKHNQNKLCFKSGYYWSYLE